MKSYLILAGFALTAACASSKMADVDTVDSSSTVAAVVPGSQADLEQTAGHRVFFAYDQYSLSSEAQSVLRRQASWLQSNPGVSIQLAGNCDERGTREYNLALGAKRAEAARDYLIAQGIEGARVTTISYGKERPVDPSSTEYAWSMNRNATTTVKGAGS